MNYEQFLQEQTRRHFFRQCGVGVGAMALADLVASSANADPSGNPLAPKPPHFPPRAKRVIYLFMAGGPSQLDMFDHKPALNRLNGQPIPPSYLEGKRFAFMDSSHRINLLGTRRTFDQYGQSGAWVSDLLPYTSKIVDELTFIRTCKTDLFNHAPA